MLKGDDRQLLKDAIGLAKLKPPALLEKENKLVEYWDEDNFSDENFEMPLRILRAIEKKKETKKQNKSNTVLEPVINSWTWVSTIPTSLIPTKTFWTFAHKRWDIENKVFHQLSTYWNIDHNFRHEPNAILNFILTAFIAFTLIQSFYSRNLKPQLRNKLSMIALASQLLLALESTKSHIHWFLSP